MLRHVLGLGLAALGSMAQTDRVDPLPWEQLKGFYSVAPVPPSQVKAEVREGTDATYVHFSFPSSAGTNARGTFARPKSGGPFPLVVLMHGLGGSGGEMISRFGRQFLSKGMAVVALDAPHHGERASEADRQELQSTVFRFAMSKNQAQGLGAFMFRDNPEKNTRFALETIQGGVKDARRALEWLKSPQHQVDSSRVGTMGISLGAMMAAILSGVDSRVNANLLVLGGDPISPFLDQLPAEKRLAAGSTAASLYLGKSTAHVLMLNGYRDTVVPRPDTFRLFESAPGSTMVFYDTLGDMANMFGHTIPAEGYTYGIDWLGKMIGAPRPSERARALSAR